MDGEQTTAINLDEWDKVTDMFTALCRKESSWATDDYREHANEARHRLLQLRVILTRIQLHQLDVVADPFALVGPNAAENVGRMVEAELDAECFYLIAWRQCAAVRRLPGFRKFLPAGVCMVRNDLIAHSKPGSTPSWGRFRFDFSCGLVLRPPGRDQPAVGKCDKGTNPNAAEFIRELRVAIERRTKLGNLPSCTTFCDADLEDRDS